jgi:hypothetical protein
MTTPTVNRVRTKDYSGKAFGAPSPFLLTKAWRVKNGASSLDKLSRVAGTSILFGQDSTNAAACTRGLSVYCGYYNGTFANLNAFRADFPNAAIILSITPNGVSGARCIDCEPGDATPAQAAQFVKNNLPEAGAGGKSDGGKPMVYCSAGDAQAVINEVAALGITRAEWILFSAHWIGQHICSKLGCGYPDADATQYDSNNSFDSDAFYGYCFGAVSAWPLQIGSSGVYVSNAQQFINNRAAAFGVKSPLVVDGIFGALTAAAAELAALAYNYTGTPAGTIDATLYSDLEYVVPGGPPPPPPPPPAWAYQQVADLKLLGAGGHSVKFQFVADPQPHAGLAKFEVVISKGDQLTTNIATYPRYIDFQATGTYTQQFGGVEPTTGYTMGVRGMAQDGSHSSEWAILHFQTA